MMENAEEIFHFLEDFSKRKPKTIPQELNDYLAYVARTGDPVYQWSLVKSLFKEKLLNVITDFYETTPGIDIPPYPNVDPFNYDIMKNSLLERLDSFNSAPFTVQRICELLTYPRKQYNRVDKFMRAVEKNILVVSTREPGHQRHPENGEPVVNGSDNNSDYNVDVEMEDMSWKDNSDSRQNSEPQPGSSEAHINVDDIETRLHIKKDTNTQENTSVKFEPSTPPDLNANEPSLDNAPKTKSLDNAVASTSDDIENNNSTPEPPPDPKIDEEMKSEEVSTNPSMIIPEIKVDDAEMTEQKLIESKASESPQEEVPKESTETASNTQVSIDDSSSDSNSKEEECKLNIEVSSSSEESSSSSDNTDGNSDSPKTEEPVDIREECPTPAELEKTTLVQENLINIEPHLEEPVHTQETEKEAVPPSLESDNYSISDVKSELPQDTAEVKEKEDKVDVEPEAEKVTQEDDKKEESLPESILKDSTNVESTEA